MCDYSLQGLPNRLAIEGEELVVHRFTTGAIGLAARKELEQTIGSHNNGSTHTLWAAISAAIFPRTVKRLRPSASGPGLCCELAISLRACSMSWHRT